METTTLFTNILFPLLSQLLKPEVWHSDPTGMGDTRLQAALLCCKVYLRFLDVLLTAPAPPPSSDKDMTNSDSSISDSTKTSEDSNASGPSAKTTSSEETIVVNKNSTTPNGTSSSADDKITQTDTRPPTGITIWLRILETMERLMKSGGGRSHAEALEEAVPESVKNIVLVMANASYLVPPPPQAAEDGGEERSELQRKLWTSTKTRLDRFLPGLMDEVFAAQVPLNAPSASTAAGGKGAPSAQTQTQAKPQKEEAEADEKVGGPGPGDDGEVD